MGDKGGEKQVDAKIIKKTQDTLGRIVKKPPLTDKLLQKPPFRFLHDIVTSVSILMFFLRVDDALALWQFCMSTPVPPLWDGYTSEGNPER